jgi:hypothetical protein
MRHSASYCGEAVWAQGVSHSSSLWLNSPPDFSAIIWIPMFNFDCCDMRVDVVRLCCSTVMTDFDSLSAGDELRYSIYPCTLSSALR